MVESLILITGRTREQAIGMHKGKASSEYQRATAFVEMNPDDMSRLAVQEGEIVRLRSAAGAVELPARAGSLPAGLVFVPMGTSVNVLVGPGTDGTGMPSFKGQRVTVERM